jgi:hypothetical protein
MVSVEETLQMLRPDGCTLTWTFRLHGRSGMEASVDSVELRQYLLIPPLGKSMQTLSQQAGWMSSHCTTSRCVPATSFTVAVISFKKTGSSSK